MTITTSLFAGILFIVIVFLGLYLMSSMRGSRAALIAAALIMGLYLPFSLLSWPGADVFALHLALYLVTCYLLAVVTAQRDKQKLAGKPAQKLHWAPVTIVLFFVVVVAVNSVFMTAAQKGLDPRWAKWLLPEPQSRASSVTSGFSGVVAEKKQHEMYYRQRVEQKHLGWNIRRGWLKVPAVGEKGILQVLITDRKDLALSAADIKGTFFQTRVALESVKNPFQEKVPQTGIDFSMLETEAGTYQADILLPNEGLWQLDLLIQKDSDQYLFRGNTRIEKRVSGS